MGASTDTTPSQAPGLRSEWLAWAVFGAGLLCLAFTWMISCLAFSLRGLPDPLADKGLPTVGVRVWPLVSVCPLLAVLWLTGWGRDLLASRRFGLAWRVLATLCVILLLLGLLASLLNVPGHYRRFAHPDPAASIRVPVGLLARVHAGGVTGYGTLLLGLGLFSWGIKRMASEQGPSCWRALAALAAGPLVLGLLGSGLTLWTGYRILAKIGAAFGMGDPTTESVYWYLAAIHVEMGLFCTGMVLILAAYGLRRANDT